MPSNTLSPLSLAASLLLVSGWSHAGDTDKVVIDDKMPIESASFCDLFDAGTLYEGDGFIKEIALHSRYHGQFISQQEEVEGSPNNGFHEYQHRRFRLGFNIEMANDLSFVVEANVADLSGLTREAFIDDFQEFYFKWKPSDEFFIAVGKQKHPFSREDIESSKRIKTIERSAIVNEVGGGRPWGAVVGFATGEFQHAVGGWLYGGHLEAPSWVDFESHGGLSYNLSREISKSTTLYFDYAYTANDGGNSSSQGPAAQDFGLSYEHSLAVGASYEKDRFELITDLVGGFNREASGTIPVGEDTWGFYIVPSYDLTDNLEAVFQYAYLDSGREQRPQRSDVRQNVENYHTFYLGLQYFLCGENLKLTGGYEIATGDVFGTSTGIETGTWMVGVRSYF
jgi:hypothetical protein